MIKTTKVYKTFYPVAPKRRMAYNSWAVCDLNLEIKQGEFYCLLGPNGAGKTTTLKLLTGLLSPTQGEIFIAGKNIANDLQQAKQLIGYIPDTPFVYEHLTCQEFLEFVGMIFGIRGKDLQQRIERYLELFGLLEARNTLLRDFSHGMKQRAVYVSNFIHDPCVLLVDEPLVGLDPQGIHLIKKVLGDKINQGMTVLMCTHILQIAQELAHRIGILSHGRLLCEGTMQELQRNSNQESLEDIFLQLTQEEARS